MIKINGQSNTNNSNNNNRTVVTIFFVFRYGRNRPTRIYVLTRFPSSTYQSCDDAPYAFINYVPFFFLVFLPFCCCTRRTADDGDRRRPEYTWNIVIINIIMTSFGPGACYTRIRAGTWIWTPVNTGVSVPVGPDLTFHRHQTKTHSEPPKVTWLENKIKHF